MEGKPLSFDADYTLQQERIIALTTELERMREERDKALDYAKNNSLKSFEIAIPSDEWHDKNKELDELRGLDKWNAKCFEQLHADLARLRAANEVLLSALRTTRCECQLKREGDAAEPKMKFFGQTEVQLCARCDALQRAGG